MPLSLQERYSYADFLTWDEDERIELVFGMPYMLATPIRIHQEILGSLHLQIGNFLEGKECRVYVAPFAVRLFEHENDRPEQVNTVVEPDLSVVCDYDKLDRTGCKGAPDFIIEILSPSTQRHDRVTKFNLYQQAGVREYWIVDPESKTVHAFVLKDGRFQAVDLYTEEATAEVNVLPGCHISLPPVFQTLE